MQQIDLYSVSVLCVYEAEGALARGAASCGRRGGRAAERGPSPEREQRVEIVSEPRTWCPPAPRVPTSGRDARPESYINKTYRMEYALYSTYRTSVRSLPYSSTATKPYGTAAPPYDVTVKPYWHSILLVAAGGQGLGRDGERPRDDPLLADRLSVTRLSGKACSYPPAHASGRRPADRPGHRP